MENQQQPDIDSQPTQPTPPVFGGEYVPEPPKKPSKWRYVFVALACIQVLGVGVFLVSLILSSGLVGSIINIMLLLALIPILLATALLNAVGLPIYIAKCKPKGAWFASSIVSLVISAMIIAYGGYIGFQLFVASPMQIRQLSEESRQKIIEQDKKYAEENAEPEITKERAISLLKDCKLKGFYYTQETEEEHNTTPATSSTGIVLTVVDGEPYRINIADRLIGELVPIAREAQKTCADPQFWHDGQYEQYKDGKWYFNNEVVNSLQTGKTKDEAISLMQSCKVDYFVGYTGSIDAIKEANTRSWLTNAEKSTTGIEVSDDSSMTYIFASKAMTADLQAAARQYRQSCYDTKKLYITIDNTIETEYPIGTWTRKDI
ncbi:MAG: hypothetical protein WAQ27_04025 [Candidatus Microsaccharimonas sp.]